MAALYCIQPRVNGLTVYCSFSRLGSGSSDGADAASAVMETAVSSSSSPSSTSAASLPFRLPRRSAAVGTAEVDRNSQLE